MSDLVGNRGTDPDTFMAYRRRRHSAVKNPVFGVAAAICATTGFALASSDEETAAMLNKAEYRCCEKP